MIVQLKKLTGAELLRGRPAGRKHFAELCGALSDLSPGEIVFLDFKGIRAVNASWLNAAIGDLFRWAADERNNIYLVLTNFPAEDLDEVGLVAAVNGQCYPVAGASTLPLRSLRIIGKLDAALMRTLEAVIENRETTGAELWSNKKSEGIGASAWNNRLKDLFDLRLVLRRAEGRKQYYSAIAERMNFDG